ncbi:DNA-binding protein [Pseudomonas sp. Pc102]|uniref:helix-turn-helix transcriptional regulator n=1 Tax=Pseudomonas sp. Pc102 TaxID=2678261 RepID=UPI001BCF74FF|nr:AlpA family transcriptional regulator [Pseudomonas sp. Pc102]BBP82415.1 DNA-binding protein [Pseudomonas sp. Pc102]
MSAAPHIDRFLRIDDVMDITGLGRATVYRRMSDGTFPKQVRIGTNSVAWRQSDIVEWMANPTASSDQSVH